MSEPEPMRQKTVTVELPAASHWHDCSACRAKVCVFCGNPYREQAGTPTAGLPRCLRCRKDAFPCEDCLKRAAPLQAGEAVPTSAEKQGGHNDRRLPECDHYGELAFLRSTISEQAAEIERLNRETRNNRDYLRLDVLDNLRAQNRLAIQVEGSARRCVTVLADVPDTTGEIFGTLRDAADFAIDSEAR